MIEVGPAGQGRAVVGNGNGFQASAAGGSRDLVDGGVGMAGGNGVDMKVGYNFHQPTIPWRNAKVNEGAGRGKNWKLTVSCPDFHPEANHGEKNELSDCNE
jgi:hypothetical protein